MAVETSWYDQENMIIYQRFSGFWSLQELVEAFRMAEAMLEPPYPPVDFIVDMRQSDWLPPGILKKSNKLSTNLSSGLTVVVTSEQFLHVLIGIFQRIVTVGGLAVAKNVEEAEALIREAQAKRAHQY